MAAPKLDVRSGSRAKAPSASHHSKLGIQKVSSGIDGLDEITLGGLPKGRPTLIYGAPGCGKTLFGIQFLARGATTYSEPGVFLSFEESVEEHKQNVRSLGYDLADLIARNLLVIEHAAIDPAREIGRGEYDLDALCMRLARAIDAAKAKRVVIDSLETIIQHERDRAIVRQAFERLFRWLKNRHVTSIVTAEVGPNGRSKHGFEDYIADCVIRLDHRATPQVSTRTMRVIKYRGSSHGTNEYPFLIDEDGIHVVPVTSVGLEHQVSMERVSSGVPRLDTMLDGKGFYRGTTVLISGTPGSGKTSLAAHYCAAACRRGERVLMFTYEESPEQVIRNMGSIGIDLRRWTDAGQLRFVAARPSMYGLEVHLAVILKAITQFNPQSVIIDPISNLVRAGDELEAHATAVRLVDTLKTKGITAVLTHPTGYGTTNDHTDLAISSIIDTWILVQSVISGGERNRTLYVLKSRGMEHSNQVREFIITSRGIDLVDVYTGPEGVLTGAARASREAQERAAEITRREDVERERRRLERHRKVVEAQIAALQSQLAADEADTSRVIDQAAAREERLASDRVDMAKRRRADNAPADKPRLSE
jgi:circadian clock protein KaiC